MNRKEYLKFIKQFTSISVAQICREKKIDRSCLLRGKASEEKTKIVYNELMNRLTELLQKGGDESGH